MNKSTKKILLVSQFFFPENFKSNDIAFDLSKRGYTVDVLSGIPNYPVGAYFKGYNIFKRRVEIIDNVKIYRSFQVPRGRKKSNVLISLNYLSFAFCSSLWAIYLCIVKQYDSIIVHQTSPITQALPAVIINKIKKAPVFVWVLDLWPEAYISGSESHNTLFYKALNWFTKKVYTNSRRILISSNEFRESILKKGDFNDKIIYFPNWSLDFKNLINKTPASLPVIPEGFIIMFAGNIGVSQDMESIINLALELKSLEDIKFVIVGDGSRKDWLESIIQEYNIKDKVKLTGQLPLELMPSIYSKANAMLLTLSGKYPDLSLYVPAKLQSYMSAGIPVLGMVNGASNTLISDSKCGYAVASGDYKRLASIITSKILNDKESFEALGLNGRKYYEKNFIQDHCINNLCDIIESN